MKTMMTDLQCPFCGVELRGEIPEQAGESRLDVALCMGCGEPVVLLDGKGTKPTFEDYEDLRMEGTLQKMQAMWEAFQKLNPQETIDQMWQRFASGPILEVFGKAQIGARSMSILQDVFICGALAGHSATMTAYDRADTLAEWETEKNKLEVEFEIYQNVIKQHILQRAEERKK